MSTLKCWVGFHSVEVEDFQLKDCDEASKTVIPGVVKDWGAPPGTTEFVCAKIPLAGTQYKDCKAKQDAPEWYTFLRHGCNGAVCYCDNEDGCNKGPKIEGINALVVIGSVVFQIIRREFITTL